MSFAHMQGEKLYRVEATISGFVLVIKVFFPLSLFLLLVNIRSAWILNYSLKSIFSMLIYCKVSHINDIYVQI